MQSDEAGFTKAVICRIKAPLLLNIFKVIVILKVREYPICFLLGAVGYGLAEVLFRGYTHWTMLIAGGVVMTLFCLINKTENLNIFLKCLIGALVITSIELAFGLVVNVLLGWKVWDYSDKPFNLFGQICPLFSLMWFFISFVGFRLCDVVAKRFSYLPAM